MNNIKDFIIGRVKSFGYAFKGIALLFSTQKNAQVHLIALIAIVLWGFYLSLNPIEWCIICICIALVLMAEAINTAIEFLVDLVSPEYHILAGKIKDVAAGAVLLCVMLCGIVWGIIFLPKIFPSFDFFSLLTTNYSNG